MAKKTDRRVADSRTIVQLIEPVRRKVIAMFIAATIVKTTAATFAVLSKDGLGGSIQEREKEVL